MKKLVKAVATFGSGREFDIYAELFPQILSEENPESMIPQLEEAVYRGVSFYRPLKYFVTPAFPEFNVPEMHQFIGNGIYITYI